MQTTSLSKKTLYRVFKDCQPVFSFGLDNMAFAGVRLQNSSKKNLN